MGEQAAVNPKASAVNAKSTTRPLRLGIDVPMLITVAFLLGFGILMVYSASWQPSMLRGESPSYYLVNQLKWAVVGIAGGTPEYVDYAAGAIGSFRSCSSPGVLFMVLIFG